MKDEKTTKHNLDSIYNSQHVLTEDYTIRTYEIDARGRLSILSLCNFMLDAAGKHAHKLGLSVQDLLTENYTWVLSRMVLKMYSYPGLWDHIKMHTWPSGIQRLFALRDFRITDRNNRTIGVAVTGWLAIDAHTRRPVRVEPFLEKIHRVGSERALMNTLEKLPAIEQYEYEQRFSVRNRDIDLNQHVNSVSYIEWVIESIPPTLQNTGILTELEINFLGEAHLGDNIISRFQPQNKDRTVFLHGIASEGDNQDLARARTVWEKV